MRSDAGLAGAEVLYVARYFPTVSETFVHREIAGLVRRGVRVHVLSMGTRDDASSADESAASVVRMPRGRALLGAALRHPRTDKLAIRVAWAAERFANVTRVHAHFAGESATLARRIAQELGVPFSVTVHAVDLFRPIGGMARLLADASPCITVCDHHASWIADVYGVSAEVVRCGVHLDVPLADPSREPARVVAVSRDVPKKGLWRLRRALPGACILGAGDWVTPSEVPGRLARFQLFALPCQVDAHGDRDGVPVAMMEAMAAGLPVVTRPVSGIPELVDDTVGWIAQDFEGALAAALADPAARSAKGRAARNRILASWTVDQQVEGLLETWRMPSTGSLRA